MARAKNGAAVDPLHGGTVHIPRSRGAVSGFLLIALGVWGAFISLVGPVFNFGLSPDQAWHWAAARFWLEVLPGAVTVLGGVLLLIGANRITTSAGAWLGVAGGTWFIVGTDLADLLHIGSPGQPTASSTGLRTLEFLACFDGLGAIILFVSAAAIGRLSVRSVRDVRAAQRREAEADAEQRRQDAYLAARRRELEGTDDDGRDEREPVPVTIANTPIPTAMTTSEPPRPAVAPPLPAPPAQPAPPMAPPPAYPVPTSSPYISGAHPAPPRDHDR
jgi:hypothetical protein